MTFLAHMDPDTGMLDAALAPRFGAELHAQYETADPFPHIVIDDFLPGPIAQQCLLEFGKIANAPASGSDTFDRPQERAKRQYSPEQLSVPVRALFHAFNSRPFLQVVENISGIEGLVPDPDFLGGGLHETTTNGHLSVHTDFNHHKRLNLERRINLLIYLNEDWSEEYGGQLEFWAEDMSRCEVSVVPKFNRAVMFNTTSTSNHGNPNPVSHPHNVSRKSIALYYYTATWDGSKRGHTTQFHARPSSTDKIDWSVKTRELAKDLVPPIVARAIGRLRR